MIIWKWQVDHQRDDVMINCKNQKHPNADVWGMHFSVSGIPIVNLTSDSDVDLSFELTTDVDCFVVRFLFSFPLRRFSCSFSSDLFSFPFLSSFPLPFSFPLFSSLFDLGVFLHEGCDKNFLINLLLTILGYIPGIIHAVWCIVSHPAGGGLAV